MTNLLNLFKKGGEHQKKLLEKLFTNYEPLERPVEDDQSSLNVSVGLALQQIVDVVSITYISKSNASILFNLMQDM